MSATASALCAHGPRCVGFDRAARLAALAAERTRLCVGCLGRVEADIRALPHDHDRLGDELAPLLGAELRTRVSGGGGDSAPMALHVEALQRAIVCTLRAWEAPVRRAAGLPAPRLAGVRDPWAVRAAVDVLAPRVAILASLPRVWGRFEGIEACERDGLAGVASLRRLHRAARMIIGPPRLVNRLPGDCSGCGAAALRRTDGSETVWCAMCDRRWTWDDYRRYAGLLLGTLGAA